MSYKKDIIRLRKQGKSYDEIEKELECSKGTISYHCKNEGLEDIGKKQHKLADEKIEQIRKLRKEGYTYDEIEEKVEVSRSAASKYSSDISKKTESDLKSYPKRKAQDFIGSKRHKAVLAESKVKTKFTELGYTVLEPQVDRRYDIAVENSGSFYRIQIKASHHKNGGVNIELRWGNSRTGRYSYKDIDYFASWNQKTEDVYLVSKKHKNKSFIRLRTKKTKNNQSKNVNFAENYKLTSDTNL